MARSLPRWLAVVALVTVLAGCRLDVGVDVTMKPDGTGTVTVVATADAELVARAPSALADLRLDDVRQAGWTVGEPTKGPDGSMSLVLAKSFHSPAEANQILNELNGPEGPLHDLTVTLDRSFADVSSSFTGTAQLSGGVAAFSDAALVQALGGKVPLADVVTQPLDQSLGLAVTARLPGTVATSNGAVSSDRASVTWHPVLTDGTATPMQARFALVDQGARDARDRSHLAWMALVIYAGAVVVVALAVWLFLRRRRRRHQRFSI